MSTESEEGPDGQRVSIGPCSNAEEYAVEFLEQHEGAAKPSVIAEEYGCTPGHMQDVLRESDQTVRVDHGEYALSTATDTTDGDAWFDVDSESEASGEAVVEAGNDDGENRGPSGDGGHRSEDLDTQDDRDGDIEEIDDQEDVDVDGDRELPSANETAGAAAAVGGASLLATDDWETQKWMLVGLATGVVVYLWWRSRSSTDGQRNEQEQDNEDDGFKLGSEGFSGVL